MEQQHTLKIFDKAANALTTRVGLIVSHEWWVCYSRPLPITQARDSGWLVKRNQEVINENILSETVGYGFPSFMEASTFFSEARHKLRPIWGMAGK